MRQVYNKLVRDRIPEIITQEGRSYALEELPDAAYQEALLAKLVEEAHEAAEAEGDELVTELADVLEVLDSILDAHSISRETVAIVKVSRKEFGHDHRPIRVNRLAIP
ncbi:MAG: nucleoside triphosphate pyrophosphohydrolase [Chloroflexota bacterium]|nr:nucleoside triphosphate pyrophosphohydrolase [Chloroflexota bacterium]